MAAFLGWFGSGMGIFPELMMCDPHLAFWIRNIFIGLHYYMYYDQAMGFIPDEIAVMDGVVVSK